MSAIIAIMNKNGIALAADSAATISDGRDKKIYLNANKIFTLSKFHPVGVMIYNSASFMDTPWEILIKVYRKQLGNTSFDTLNEYYINFIEFLRERSFFSSLEEQKDILGRKAFELLDRFSEESFFKHKDLFTDINSNIEEINSIYKDKAEVFINFIKTEYTTCSDFEDYTKNDFLEFSDTKIEEVLEALQLSKFKFKLNTDNIELTKELLFQYYTRNYYFFPFSGLVFVGFGENQIYPQLTPVNISIALDNRLRYHVDDSEVAGISDSGQKSVQIKAFAQTDVINTILYGIDPTFYQFQENIFSDFINKYHDHMVDLVKDAPDELKEQVKSYEVTSIIEEMKNATLEVQKERFARPLYQAVASLAKEDLGEMAESLIKLTYLKRRMMFDEESVSGPVDVAIITKGDGFIWEKRKFYFDKDLNPHFFQNYLNTDL